MCTWSELIFFSCAVYVTSFGFFFLIGGNFSTWIAIVWYKKGWLMWLSHANHMSLIQLRSSVMCVNLLNRCSNVETMVCRRTSSIWMDGRIDGNRWITLFIISIYHAEKTRACEWRNEWSNPSFQFSLHFDALIVDFIMLQFSAGVFFLFVCA